MSESDSLELELTSMKTALLAGGSVGVACVGVACVSVACVGVACVAVIFAVPAVVAVSCRCAVRFVLTALPLFLRIFRFFLKSSYVWA